MPEFAPGEAKTAIAPITVSPSGLSCEAELYLVSNSTKMVTSGKKAFTSTGAKQDISLPVTMPDAEGTYPVWLDVFAGGLLVGAYQGIEDVVVKAAIPEIIVDFDALSVLDVEGRPFISIGIETVPNWGALAGALAQCGGQTQYGGYIVPGGEQILAECIIAKGASAASLYQCGIEHPECLTALAKSYQRPSTGFTDVASFPERFGATPYVCLTVPIAGGAANLHVTELFELWGEPMCRYTITWVQTYWQQVYQYIWDCCQSALAPFTGLVATLAEPIEMSKIRGVSLTWLNKAIPIYTDCGTIWILQYRPTFSAEMPPPGFRIISLRPQAVGETGTALITGCYAGGYYYPGIYDGIVTVEAGCGYRDGTFTSYAGGGRFMIKNLAKVTGKGTVVPPGY